MFRLWPFSGFRGLWFRQRRAKPSGVRARWKAIWLLCAVVGLAIPGKAVILWNDPDPALVHENGMGTDVLRGALKRDDTANDTLYFKFQVEPLSDKDTEDYLAAFELFEGAAERLGMGNALKAWAYSAFFHGAKTGESDELAAYLDLHTRAPELPTPGAAGSYQYPRRGVAVTIVFKVQYVPGEDDLVTVWLNPDLGPGANESSQPEGLTTRFNANAAFDEIHLRHIGGGEGWKFSDLAIATSFSDFVDSSSARPPASAGSLVTSARAFSFQVWQKEQGLPQTPVRALLQTRDGYLWIASDSSLSRFDGLRFVVFGIQEGLKAGALNALFEDSNSTLWAGGGAGISFWEQGHVRAVPFPEGFSGKTVTAMAEDGQKRLWIGTDAGLLLRQGSRFLALPEADPFKGHSINALLKDGKEQLWVAVEDVGVFLHETAGFVALSGSPEDALLKKAHCLLTDRFGRLWIGAGDDLILCRDQNQWHRYLVPHNQAKSQVTVLGEEFDGTVWAGLAGGGLLEQKAGRFVSVLGTAGLAGNLVQSFFSDRQGSLWIGTDAGLNRLHRRTLLTLGQSEGLGLGRVQGLAEISPGVVWVSKPDDGLYRWDGRNLSRLSVKGLSAHGSQVTSLLVTHDGFCWVATTNGLLLFKDTVAAADEVKVINSAPSNIVSLAEGRESTLWSGTHEGALWQLKAGKWHAETNLSQTSAITALATDGDGSLWVGTDGNGLYHVAKPGSHMVEKIQGLSRVVRALHVDVEGTVWIGTGDQGLSCWRNGRLASPGTGPRLPRNISQILEDDSGRLWLGSDEGIACVRKDVLEDPNTKQPVYAHLFGKADGMLAEQCSEGFCPAGLKTKSGLLWFPTVQGVAVVNPKVEPAMKYPPNTVLEEVIVDGVPTAEFQDLDYKVGHSANELPADGGLPALRIGPGRHRVEFRYTGLSFDSPDLLRFRYRLEGLDTDWVDAGTRRTAFYSYLPPGVYRFHIAACDRDGVWSGSTAGLELSVLRHFWQTRWFIAVAGIGLMVLVIGVVRAIEKAKLNLQLKHLEQERALERERTRIAQDLHDQMGAKLCRISFLSEHARRGDLRPNEMHEQISSISDASREVLHSLDEIVWAVNPQNDTLEHVASYIGQYAQEYFQMTGIECELDIPTQFPPRPLSSQMRHHLFLATHETLTNILKHSEATRATVSMRCREETFEIHISDNGKGFDSSAAKVRPDSSPIGDGLTNISKRVADIGGRCWIDSEPGKGTRVGFVIPLASFKNGK